jgi:erythromycin esterase-like protein
VTSDDCDEASNANRSDVLRDSHDTPGGLRQPRLERAIGVIYQPDTERISDYFDVRLAEQFDAALHFGETQAVEPLERSAAWDRGRAPETFPSAL